jgi:hypothetical protein
VKYKGYIFFLYLIQYTPLVYHKITVDARVFARKAQNSARCGKVKARSKAGLIAGASGTHFSL